MRTNEHTIGPISPDYHIDDLVRRKRVKLTTRLVYAIKREEGKYLKGFRNNS